MTGIPGEAENYGGQYTYLSKAALDTRVTSVLFRTELIARGSPSGTSRPLIVDSQAAAMVDKS